MNDEFHKNKCQVQVSPVRFRLCFERKDRLENSSCPSELRRLLYKETTRHPSEGLALKIVRERRLATLSRILGVPV